MDVNAPTQIITAPAQLITALLRPPTTGVSVYTALFSINFGTYDSFMIHNT